MSREKIIDVMASGIFNGTFGGTSDPTLADLTAALAHSQAKDALTALEAAGYAIVPVEPTERMLDAAKRVFLYSHVSFNDTLRPAYRAMLQSAKGE